MIDFSLDLSIIPRNSCELSIDVDYFRELMLQLGYFPCCDYLPSLSEEINSFGVSDRKTPFEYSDLKLQLSPVKTFDSFNVITCKIVMICMC